ncbi:hypothetical protein PR202_ga28876 [Eleusine coracana subsp. coracana]|uniref:Uncharacterized protein n=1 Tax=Eleusine coracana subsp. coracana TaxID=191504 RepID=A0AAV5DI72_ELECO|nr:hypothetical protein PR202_ga28876 [Eleusine coracana subsp. coracana]
MVGRSSQTSNYAIEFWGGIEEFPLSSIVLLQGFCLAVNQKVLLPLLNSLISHSWDLFVCTLHSSSPGGSSGEGHPYNDQLSDKFRAGHSCGFRQAYRSSPSSVVVNKMQGWSNDVTTAIHTFGT